MLSISWGDLIEFLEDTQICFWITSLLSRIKMRQDLSLILFVFNMMFLNLTNWSDYANRSNQHHYRYWSIPRTGSYSIKAFQFQPWWKSRCPDGFYDWFRWDSLLSLFLYLSCLMDLIILIPLGLVALVGAYLCYHFIFHRNEPHDFWSHTSKVDPDDSHGNQEPHI